MQTKEAALIKIKSLIKRFDEQKEFYRKGDDNETQTRRDFIGGFDCIIGNPPYVDYRLISENEITYFKGKYHSANTKEKYSLYIPFIELGHKLLKSNGKFGFIIPNTFLATNMGLKLREYLIKESSISEIKDVSKLKVFGNVGTYPVLLFLNKKFNKKK
ncbi:MAG: Eco57I restriction-modification methylase domain-containing protein [Chitinophagaceae bacterium]|nr:Eco57I restriction-modification methylase domain-containing protein [Chitinophagaceae bacterium]MCW5905625.1 Eco57I restriction-modification methylase domain-containing protein [Chitinophagaceae bacterium]